LLTFTQIEQKLVEKNVECFVDNFVRLSSSRRLTLTINYTLNQERQTRLLLKQFSMLTGTT